MFVFSICLLTACSNKVDKTLDKMEDILDRYEKKVQNRTFSRRDLQDMSTQVTALDEEFRTQVGKPQSDWTDSERARSARLTARQDKLIEAAPRQTYGF
jgi:hypothetical protein